jgi:voltage-gated potassium channel Kch
MPVIPVVFGIWMMSGRVRRVILRGLKDPETRGLIYATLIVLAAGTTFYRLVEGWRWLDSLYFSVITLTTVGFGDLAPQSDAGKLFTVFYILVGLGILCSFIALIAEQLRQPEPESSIQ